MFSNVDSETEPVPLEFEYKQPNDGVIVYLFGATLVLARRQQGSAVPVESFYIGSGGRYFLAACNLQTGAYEAYSKQFDFDAAPGLSFGGWLRRRQEEADKARHGIAEVRWETDRTAGFLLRAVKGVVFVLPDGYRVGGKVTVQLGARPVGQVENRGRTAELAGVILSAELSEATCRTLPRDPVRNLSVTICRAPADEATLKKYGLASEATASPQPSENEQLLAMVARSGATVPLLLSARTAPSGYYGGGCEPSMTGAPVLDEELSVVALNVCARRQDRTQGYLLPLGEIKKAFP
ncbi:MAG TPA: hypothetical protein VF017_08070 [Thermoanaerobaculia bacterium]|nr:hypothetical protein [Thermoanaerobaculia bacterium]